MLHPLHSRLWQLLEEVASYKPPTVQQPGTYRLKPAAFAEFDPLFWFRDSKKAEVRRNVCAAGFAVSGDDISISLHCPIAPVGIAGATVMTRPGMGAELLYMTSRWSAC